ncbi:MAG: ATP-binding cassette domain-containing protein [Gammaproteobacteria bacterium]
MLNFKNIALRRGSRQLFSGASFTVHKGEKAGVTGANGVGKSSLFALVRGELFPDEGEFSMPPGLEIAHVAQETPAVETPAVEYVTDGDRELRVLQGRLSVAEKAGDGLRQAELHARLESIGGYSARARASKLMDGLGFTPDRQDAAVHEFSGGWRMRLNLAQALMCRSDVLLLDEPTNHLDLDAVIWLQDWLVKYQGTLLLISHDRDFLDSVADHIVHIEQGKAEIYTGNYTAFEKLRAEKLARQQSAYEKQQREIAHIRSFVERFKAKATKAKQAQSRIKSLQRMELIVQAHVDSPFDFSFAVPDKLPNPLLTLDKVALGYGDKTVLSGVDLSIAPGDRIGLLGSNGAGKSSLIKFLAGELAPQAGAGKKAEGLKIGYFAQHQLEQLRADESPLRHLQGLQPDATEKDLRNFLGGFDFHGDKALEPIGLFSGGEKARLVLAMLVLQKPNLLLLDEPTNHLDLEMRQALGLALQDYEGAIVVVSHDRHLLRSVADRLVLVAHGAVAPFDGDLEDYRRWLAEERSAADAPFGGDIPGMSRKDQRRLEAEKRNQLKPLKDALVKAERQVENLQNEKTELEQLLSDPEIYTDSEKERLKSALLKKIEIDRALEDAEALWLDAHEKWEECL